MSISDPELSRNVRVREIEETLGTNEAFRSYVQSTAFSISLSRTQIRTLNLLDEAITAGHPYGRFPIDTNRVTQLMRRGLVTHTPPGREEVRDATWDMHYTITRAGRLVLDLLYEAGLLSSTYLARHIPLAPPGWLDPRPKIRLDAQGAWMEPSDRTAAGNHGGATT